MHLHGHKKSDINNDELLGMTWEFFKCDITISC